MIKNVKDLILDFMIMQRQIKEELNGIWNNLIKKQLNFFMGVPESKYFYFLKTACLVVNFFKEFEFIKNVTKNSRIHHKEWEREKKFLTTK
jgi:hypothetical protein